jgi:hypothetical protein
MTRHRRPPPKHFEDDERETELDGGFAKRPPADVPGDEYRKKPRPREAIVDALMEVFGEDPMPGQVPDSISGTD